MSKFASYGPWTIDLAVKPSRVFRILVAGLYVLALVALWQTAVAGVWKFLLLLCLVTSAVMLWRSQRFVSELIVREQIGRWWLETPQHKGAAKLSGYQAWRYLVIMRFKTWDKKGRQTRTKVVVWSDAVDADSFRRLRVRLRYGHALLKADDF